MMDFLDSAEWSNLLRESFGGFAVHTAGEATGSRKLAWFVFRFGPLRIAYPRFPVGLLAGDLDSSAELESHLAQLRDHGVHVAQISVEGDAKVGVSAGHHSVDLPETTIRHLQTWSEASLTASCRAKVRRATREGLHVEDAGLADAKVVFALYRQSIARHGGSARYPQRYFEALTREAIRGPDLRVGVARTPTGEAVGFIATMLHGHRTSYLHGGFDESASRLRPGYSCMHWAIGKARVAGSTEFGMLTSPARQAALVDYKESFGGTTLMRRHYSVATSLLGHPGALALAWNARRRQR
jgi:hypothetical protein